MAVASIQDLRTLGVVKANRRPRLLIVSQYYHPEPGFVTRDIAARMQHEMDVVVVTAQPNFPLGHFYEGVFRPYPRRSVEDGGVVVWRLPIVPDHSLSKVNRLLNYLSFALLATIFAPFVAGRPDTVLVYQTPNTSALAALWFRYVLRSRLVYVVADLWPESLLAAGLLREGTVARAMHTFRVITNRWANAIACTTRGTAQQFVADGIPAERLHFVPVWISTVPDELPAIDVAPSSATPRIVYVGNVGPLQALESVIRAAEILEAQGLPVHFEIYGSGTDLPRLTALAEELGVTTVSFPGRVDGDAALAISAGATGQIVFLLPTPMLERTIPSKLFFAMAAGSPILAGLRGEPAALAESTGGAIIVDVEEPESVATAVRKLIQMPAASRQAMSNALRSTYSQHYSRQHLLEKYATLLNPHA